MSFDPVCGPDSSSYIYIRSLVSAYFTSLTALCSSLLTTILSGVNDLAVRVHSSCCPLCQYDRLRESYLKQGKREEKRTTALVFDCGTGVYTWEEYENIDVEKAIHRPADSIKVQVPEGTRALAELPGPNARKPNSIYIKPGHAHKRLPKPPVHESFKQIKTPVELAADERNRASIPPVSQHIQRLFSSSKSTPPRPPAHESLKRTNAPVKLPAGRVSPVSMPPVSQPLHRRSSSAPLPRTPKLPAYESFKQKNLPAEPPADEASPLSAPPVPQPFHRRSSSTPVLGPPPQPRSPNTRRNMPLLIPPKDGASEKTISRGSSLRSANIPIAYWPSNQHYDPGGENPVPLKALDTFS